MASDVSLDLNHLLSTLQTLPAAQRYWVALSGGCDSMALLHAMATLRPRLAPASLGSVHVDHSLHPDSAAWAQHCRAFAAGLGVECVVLRVDARPGPGQSREAAARTARYRALANWLQPGDVLLTAHHREDQAETVLLQLMRGAGSAGLAAMPVHTSLGAGVLARPLLTVPRDALRSYATHYDLVWVEDPSNFDTSLDRNYLRHEIMPRLRMRWPAADVNLSRAAQHQGETTGLLEALARYDLQRVQAAHAGVLRIDRLLELDEPRQRNALRGWLRERGLPLPSARILRQIGTDVLRAGWDREPCVTWSGAQVRRYRNGLYAMTPWVPIAAATSLEWRPHEGPLRLPHDGSELHAHHAPGRGLRYDPSQGPLRIRFRQGGERCRPTGAAHTRTIKALFQERGVPPWERDRTPFIYVDDTLAAVADHWVCADHAAGASETGLVIEWRRLFS